MKKTEILKANINGLTISTVKLGRVYETMVIDALGNELKVMRTTRKVEAQHNHLNCAAQYVVKRNCIHAI